MHINVGNKNMHIDCLHITRFGVKGRINKSQQFFVQPEAFESLMLET